MTNQIRPRLDELYYWKIRQYYPQKTRAMKSIEKVIEFGLKMGLEYAQHMKYCDSTTREVS